MAGIKALVCSAIGVAVAVLGLGLYLEHVKPESGDPPPPSAEPASTPLPPADAGSAPPIAAVAKEGEYPRLPAASRDKSARVWSVEELSAHTGEDHSKPLLICIVGEVYDVGPGKRFYAPGGGYQFFAGKDASNGFASGSEGGGLSSDLAHLSAEEAAEVIKWRDDFYRTHEEYRFVGYLNERYYDEKGEPREAWSKLVKLKLQAGKADEARQAMEQKFMSCNSRHEADKATFEIWCDDSYHRKGSTPLHLHYRLPSLSEGGEQEISSRCACVPPSERAEADAEGNRPKPGKADVQIVDYPECKKGAQRCHRPQGSKNPPASKWS